MTQGRWLQGRTSLMHYLAHHRAIMECIDEGRRFSYIPRTMEV